MGFLINPYIYATVTPSGPTDYVLYLDAWTGTSETLSYTGGTTWYDLSSYGNDSYLKEGTATKIGPLYDELTATFGFTKSPADWVDLGYSGAVGNSSAYTYTQVISASDVTGFNRGLSNSDRTGGVSGFFQSGIVSSNFRSSVSDSGGQTLLDAGTPVNDQVAVHTTVCSPTEGLKSYVDGVLIASGAYRYADLLTPVPPPMWGGINQGTVTGGQWGGNLYYLKYWDKEKTASEVLDEYDAIKSRYGLA